MTPQKLINPKALSAVIRDFFGRSQLSQFMDQTNPARRADPQRRLSALARRSLAGSRGFEVRDVHPSHYGASARSRRRKARTSAFIRRCRPLHASTISASSRTPYRKVTNGRVTDQIDYLTGDREENYSSPRRIPPSMTRAISPRKKISVRYRGDFLEVERPRSHMDVSPEQLVSVARLIRSSSTTTRNRALMGSKHATPGRAAARQRSAARRHRAWKQGRRDSRRSSSPRAMAK